MRKCTGLSGHFFLLARSLRLSNRKLREATGWRPMYPSMHQGWPALLAELGEAAHGKPIDAHATR